MNKTNSIAKSIFILTVVSVFAFTSCNTNLNEEVSDNSLQAEVLSLENETSEGFSSVHFYAAHASYDSESNLVTVIIAGQVQSDDYDHALVQIFKNDKVVYETETMNTFRPDFAPEADSDYVVEITPVSVNGEKGLTSTSFISTAE